MIVEWMEDHVGWIVGAILVPIVILGLYAAYLDYVSPDLATLKKSEWKCTRSHMETVWMSNGKGMFPVYQDVCDQYERK